MPPLTCERPISDVGYRGLTCARQSCEPHYHRLLTEVLPSSLARLERVPSEIYIAWVPGTREQCGLDSASTGSGVHEIVIASVTKIPRWGAARLGCGGVGIRPSRHRPCLRSRPNAPAGSQSGPWYASRPPFGLHRLVRASVRAERLDKVEGSALSERVSFGREVRQQRIDRDVDLLVGDLGDG